MLLRWQHSQLRCGDDSKKIFRDKVFSDRPTGPCVSCRASLAVPAAAETTIGTTVNGTQAKNTIGTGFSFLGQVFTSPTDNVLTSFSVQLLDVEPDTRFTIYAFDTGTHMTTGAPLFSSGPVAGRRMPATSSCSSN